MGDRKVQDLKHELELLFCPWREATRGRVHWDLDIPEGFNAPEACLTVVSSLVRQSLGSMPEGGELLITAVATAAGLELEVADTGPSWEFRPRSVPMALASVRGRIHWHACPQGGMAATIIIPTENSRNRVAA
jgi:hypothetical protein